MFTELKITLCANPEELAEVVATGAFSLEGTTLCDAVPAAQRNNQPGFQRWRLAQMQPVHLIIDLEVQLLETLVASVPARSLARLDDFLWRSGWFMGLPAMASEIRLYYKNSWYLIKQPYKE